MRSSQILVGRWSTCWQTSAFALGLIGVWDGEMLAWAAASLIFLSVSTRNWWLDAALEKKALTRAFGHRAEAVDDLFTRNSLLSEIQMHNRVSLAASLLGTATVALVLRLLSTAPNIPSWVSALVAVAGLWGASHLAKNLGHHWLEKDLGVLLQYVKVELGMNGWRYVGLWERSSH